MSKLGLIKAAEATGKSPSTIHRAMKAGRLSYEVNDHGERIIDASELFRVFPPKSAGDSPEPLHTSNANDVARHDAQLIRLEVELRAAQEKIAVLEQLLDELRQERHLERQEKERLLSILERQTMLLPKPQEQDAASPPPTWWQRWFH